MIKAFLFDYDGVITVGVTDNAPAERLAQQIGVPVGTAAEWIRTLWEPHVRGFTSEDEFWRGIEQYHGGPIDSGQRDIWHTWDELTPLPEMLQLVRMLKAKGYSVGLLSNATALTARVIRAHGGYNEFDFTVISSEVGHKKPEPEIYQIALGKLPGIAPKEVLFLDDRETGVVAAQKLGVQTIFFTDRAKAIAEVRSIAA
jgi:putative hydrolase of the HAD superfamily